MSATLDALAVGVEADVPVALRGPPGVGKSSLVRLLAESLGYHLEVVIGSLREPSDFAGLPIIQADGNVRLAPPAWAVRANAATGGAIVLLDELTAASPATQSAMLRVVLERVVGDLTLEPHVRIVAAYNDAVDCGGYDLEPPVRSRFCHIEVRAHADKFASGLLGQWATPTTVRRPDNAHNVERRWRACVAGFITARPSMILTPPEPGTTGGYPTPRTWEMAARLGSTAEHAGADDDVTTILLAGVVGFGAAAEFWSYRRQLDLPNPEALLETPAAIGEHLDHHRPDRVMAILAAVVDNFIARPSSERWVSLWEIAALSSDKGFGDLVVWLFRPAITQMPAGARVTNQLKSVAAQMGSAA